MPANPGYVIYNIAGNDPSRVKGSAVIGWAIDDITFAVRPIPLEDNLPITPSPGRYIAMAIPGGGLELIKPGQSLPTGYVLAPGFSLPRTVNNLRDLGRAILLVQAHLVRPSDVPPT